MRVRRNGLVMIQREVKCTGCGERFMHVEVMPEGDAPHGLESTGFRCDECGGVLAVFSEREGRIKA